MPSGKQRKRKPPPPPPSKIAGWVGVAIVALVLAGALATPALKLHVFLITTLIGFGDEHDTRQVELRPDRSSQGADARFILWRLAARGSES